jgi:hypothetical protein
VGMGDVVEKAFDVGFHHPSRPFVGDDLGHTAQRARHSPERGADCCLPEAQTRRHSPTKFSRLNTFRVGFTRYLCTSPAHHTYASTRPLPPAPQGSILGSRLTITQAGLAPARTRGLARPHWPLFPTYGKHTCRTPWIILEAATDPLWMPSLLSQEAAASREDDPTNVFATVGGGVLLVYSLVYCLVGQSANRTHCFAEQSSRPGNSQ